MKTFILGFVAAVIAGNVLAADRFELDQRVHNLTTKFEALQSKPDKCVPPEVLRIAQGIILLERTKAGFVFAYQGGGGVALAKDSHSGQWSPVAFVSANEASLGPQIGGEQNFFVIVMSDTNSMRVLMEPGFEIKSEVRSTAGGDSAGLEGRVSKPNPPMMVYDDRKGLFAGAGIKAGSIAPDERANQMYYEQFLTLNDILFENKAKPTEASKALANKITEYSGAKP